MTVWLCWENDHVHKVIENETDALKWLIDKMEAINGKRGENDQLVFRPVTHHRWTSGVMVGQRIEVEPMVVE